MKSLLIKNDLYWVGALDPNLRVFDIIMYTPYGTTYNSYVVKGSEKIAVFETVKEQFFDEYLARLQDLNIDPKTIDYIVVNHTEPDHAGSVSKLLDIAPNAKIVGSAVALRFLRKIANRDFESITANDGATLSLGNKTLKFISAPFLHWPDSMYTYIEEDNVLVTCDSFGSHYSFDGVLNSKIDNEDHYMEALRYYYDCIFGPYKPYVIKAYNKIKDLSIDMVCPGHGPVLVEDPWKIINLYKEWSTPADTSNKKKQVTIPYVSAYGYTETLAKEIGKGIEAAGDIDVKLFNVINHKMEDILASIGNSEGLICGSPTIVGELLEPIRDLLSKLNPVVHGGKYAGAFGSYGWSGEAIPRMESRLTELNMKLIGPSLKINFKPDETEVNTAYTYGLDFGKTLLGEKEYKPFNVNTLVPVSTGKDGKVKLWKCVICGEIFESVDAPETCNVCGAGSDAFVEVEKEAPIPKFDKVESYVVIGNGAAGFYATKSIKERNSFATIYLISEEKEHSYVRTQLSDLLTEEPQNDFYLAKDTWYKNNEINEILGVKVVEIDNKAKTVILNNGDKIKFDKLILANGSYNFIPPTDVNIKNEIVKIDSHNYKNINGIHTIKNLHDIKLINESLNTAKNVLIVGGGLLGLEAAWEIQKKNIKVDVIELADTMLPRQLDSDGSIIFENIIKNSTINMRLNSSIKVINADNNGVTSVELNNGTIIDTDLVLYSVGVRPNTDLAKLAGVEVNRGIVVDRQMRTNIEDIYACGDVAEIRGNCYCNWPAAIEMGKVAGANVVGDEKSFRGFISSVIFNAIGTEVFSAGTVDFNDKSLKKLGFIDSANNVYSKLFFKNDIIVGGILIGDLSNSSKIILGIEQKKTLNEFK